YTGIEMRDDVLWLNPCLPKELVELSFCLHYRGHWLHLRFDHRSMTVSFERCCSNSRARIGVAGEVHEMWEGDEKYFHLPPA
ncbi:MAG: glycosyl hydrolase family 65 protein, partial [Chromatocurvus sp.]